jgi:outer membrane protein OmpU
MRRLLLGSTALIGAGLAVASQPAIAADGIKLGVGGYFRTAYMVVFDDDSEGEPGNERNTDGVFSDAEIHFTGSTVLDNGLEVGARVELEGEDDTSPTGDGDQIDEAWIYFSGGFGELRVGSIDDALGTMCVFAPGGTANFSAYSPNQWGANTLTSNSICFGVDDVGDSQKLLYLSPIFSGFQLALSYVPSSDKERHGDGVGAHLGMPVNVDDTSRHNVSAYGVYNFEAENWWLQVGAGGSWEGNVEKANGAPNREESEFYQTGILLGFGDFQVGASLNYFNDDDLFSATLENGDVVADPLGARRRRQLHDGRVDLRHRLLDQRSGHRERGRRGQRLHAAARGRHRQLQSRPGDRSRRRDRLHVAGRERPRLRRKRRQLRRDRDRHRHRDHLLGAGVTPIAGPR